MGALRRVSVGLCPNPNPEGFGPLTRYYHLQRKSTIKKPECRKYACTRIVLELQRRSKILRDLDMR